MELHVSPDSLGSSFRPTQTELYSREYVIKKTQEGQYNNTYFFMVSFLTLSFIDQPAPIERTRDRNCQYPSSKR